MISETEKPSRELVNGPLWFIVGLHYGRCTTYFCYHNAAVDLFSEEERPHVQLWSGLLLCVCIFPLLLTQISNISDQHLPRCSYHSWSCSWYAASSLHFPSISVCPYGLLRCVVHVWCDKFAILRPFIMQKALRAAAHFASGLTMEKSLSRSSVKELFWDLEGKK